MGWDSCCWEHERDTGELMLGFPQKLRKERAVTMANWASLCVQQVTQVLWVDVQHRHEGAQCQDCGAGVLIMGSAHCKKALQDKGPPAEHCCPPIFTLHELLSPTLLYAIISQSHQQSVLSPEGEGLFGLRKAKWMRCPCQPQFSISYPSL